MFHRNIERRAIDSSLASGNNFQDDDLTVEAGVSPAFFLLDVGRFTEPIRAGLALRAIEVNRPYPTAVSRQSEQCPRVRSSESRSAPVRGFDGEHPSGRGSPDAE